MKRFKIAIVEDDEDERFFMVDAFNSFAGFEVVGEFGNGDQLMAWLGKQADPTTELVITDLNMPGKNGYDIISEVRSKYSGIDVVATSTSSVDATRNKCLAMGARQFLVKPDVFIHYQDYVERLYQLLSPVKSSN
jgi:DNA-binding NarL/FixJ family response regulator